MHKGQWRGTLMFSLICAWIIGWINNREAGDLRRHRAHYDVIVMMLVKVYTGWKACCSIRLLLWPKSMEEPRAPSQYPKIRLFVRSRKVSKPRDLYIELSDRSENWQALRQQCCRCACQISKRYDNLKYQCRGFETLRDLTKRRLFGYWDGAQVSIRRQGCRLKWDLQMT